MGGRYGVSVASNTLGRYINAAGFAGRNRRRSSKAAMQEEMPMSSEDCMDLENRCMGGRVMCLIKEIHEAVCVPVFILLHVRSVGMR